MDWSTTDKTHMQQALELAQQGASSGEVPVGAVLVIDGDVVAKAHNRTLLDNDPTGHAEVISLRAAAEAVGNHRLNNATLYVTLEPCVMCAGAIAHARLARVVFGAYDRKAGALGSVEDLSDSRALNHHVEVNGGLMAEQCGSLLTEFFTNKRG